MVSPIVAVVGIKQFNVATSNAFKLFASPIFSSVLKTPSALKSIQAAIVF
jgi:hypothetical protein